MSQIKINEGITAALMRGSRGAARSQQELAALDQRIASWQGEFLSNISNAEEASQIVSELIHEAHECGRDLKLRADRMAVELNTSFRGPLRRLERILKALTGRDEFQRQAICDAYFDRYGRDLSYDINTKLKGAKRDLALSLVQGDLPGELAARITLSFKSYFKEVIFENLCEIFRDGFIRGNSSTLQAGVAVFNERYASSFKAADFGEVLCKYIDLRRTYFILILKDDLIQATSWLLEFYLTQPRKDWDFICELLEQLPNKVRLEVVAKWRNGGEPEANAHFTGKKRSNHDARIDWYRALIEGDDIRVCAAKLRVIVEGRLSLWPGEIFRHKSNEIRRAILEEYKVLFGSDAVSDLSRYSRRRHDLELLRTFIKGETLAPAQLLRDCIFGYGTDVKGVKLIISNLSPESFEQVNADYKHRYNRDLRVDLDLDLDPDDRFDVRYLIQGPPASLTESYERMCERFEHERSGILARLLHFFTPEWRGKKRDYDLAKEHYQAITANGRVPSAKEIERFNTLASFVVNACDSFRITKHKVADIASNILSIVTVAAATSLGFSIGGWKTAYIIGASATFAVSFLTRVPAQVALKGKSYGMAHVLRDLSYALADGLTLTLGRIVTAIGPLGHWIVKGALGKTVLEGGGRLLMKTGVGIGYKADERKKCHYVQAESAEATPRTVAEIIEIRLGEKIGRLEKALRDAGPRWS